MAPNNALKGKKSSSSSSESKSNSKLKKEDCEEDQGQNSQKSKSSVLEEGTVEARGIGTHSAADTIDRQIHDFMSRSFSFQDEIRSFFTVWTFLTRLPGPTWVDHHPGYLMRGMPTFPIIGTIIGYFCAVWYDMVLAFVFMESTTTGSVPTNKIASAVSLAASFWLTGCFHEDGLADSSDGIGGGWSRTQILTIMSDTRLGTYGCAVLILYVYSKLELVALTGMTGLLLAHTYARWTPCYMIRTNDYIDDSQGPKTAYYSFMMQAKNLVTWPRVLIATVYTLLIGVLCLASWAKAVILLFVMWLLSVAAGRYSAYLLGGVMGDYLGAVICVAEIIVYILHVNLMQWKDLDSTIIDFVNNIRVQGHLQFDWENLPQLSEHQATVTFHFLWMIIGTSLWNRYVGPPDVFVREVAIANQDGDQLNIGLNDAALKNKKEQQEADKKKEVSLSPLAALLQRKPDATFVERYDATQSYIDSLAKPMGSLGTLEEWAARLGALRGTLDGSFPINKASCLIFAADHGVAKSPQEGGEGCSAYPQAVTQSVVVALDQGTAGASVLARANNVDLRVVDVGIVSDKDYGSEDGDESPTVVPGSFRLSGGTKNCCQEPAMTADEVDKLLQAGRDAVKLYVAKEGMPIMCLGEVGIGNTTTSSIILASITGIRVDSLVDGGARLGKEVDPVLVKKKQSIVEKALKRFRSRRDKSNSPSIVIRRILAEFGGAEIVAIVGALLEAAERNLPVIVDGFIATTSALAACMMSPMVTQILFFATQSTERGQSVALEKIGDIAKDSGLPSPATPALAMKLRMGEGTGAIMAVPLLRSGAAMLSDMATLEQILVQKS